MWNPHCFAILTNFEKSMLNSLRPNLFPKQWKIEVEKFYHKFPQLTYPKQWQHSFAPLSDDFNKILWHTNPQNWKSGPNYIHANFSH